VSINILHNKLEPNILVSWEVGWGKQQIIIYDIGKESMGILSRDQEVYSIIFYGGFA
jgi:hypothetical protein